MRHFNTGATRDSDEGKLHYKGFLSTKALGWFAEYMESHRTQADGSVRAPDNWKKGIPLDAYEDSLTRHFMEWLDALEDGDYSRADAVAPALFFNLQGWMHERVKASEARRPASDADMQALVAGITGLPAAK